MTLQSINGFMFWPGVINGATTFAMATLATLDAAGEYAGAVLVAKENMVISHVSFRPGVVAGSPTANIRIETVATDGLPSGTLWATNTNIVTGTLVSNTNAVHALTAAASITKGQMFCVKIQYNSGTSFIVQSISGSLLTGASSLPYTIVNVGTPTKGFTGASVSCGLGSSSSAFYQVPGVLPTDNAGSTATYNNTSSAARGLRFKVPFKCRCVGIRWGMTAVPGNYNAVLYNDAGTELSSSSTAYDGDQVAASASNVMALFDNNVTLEPDTWYRIAIEPSSATNVAWGFVDLGSVNYMSAWPGGVNAHYVTRASAVWDDTLTDHVPAMDIIVDQLDDGVSAGSGGGLKLAGRGGLAG